MGRGGIIPRLYDVNLPKGNKPRHFALRVAEIPETDGTPDTFFRTERLQTLIDPVATQSALFSVSIFHIEADRIVGTGVGTGPASGAFLFVGNDNPIGTFIHGSLCWTGC